MFTMYPLPVRPEIHGVVQQTLDRLFPGFNQQTFQDMLLAYETDADFLGTDYENETDAVQAFYLYWEMVKLETALFDDNQVDLGHTKGPR